MNMERFLSLEQGDIVERASIRWAVVGQVKKPWSGELYGVMFARVAWVAERNIYTRPDTMLVVGVDDLDWHSWARVVGHGKVIKWGKDNLGNLFQSRI